VRLIVLFLIGLALGAIGTLIAINTLNRQTPWSKATMAVIGQQMKAVGGSVKANHCAATDLQPKLQTLRLVANDIEPAFGEDGKDPQFGRYAADLRAAADAALAKPPANCTEANAVLTSLDKACDSCHRDFRG
jgi:cytochrome c556